MATSIQVPGGTFRGYERNRLQELPPEDLLHRVGPGTPCGEYLRRFWQPVMLSSMVKDLPVRIRRLGEDLVIFRDGSGALGLLHAHCSHRNTSLEYGIIEQHGIRCCYHGWHYALDGTIRDTPGEPPESRIRQRVMHGAYPVVEVKGLIFAYMGPPEKQPPFPLFDTMDLPDDDLVPALIPNPCNWQQVAENSIDPYHVVFLHSRVSGIQFQREFELMPVYTYFERPNGVFYTSVRRVDDFVWVRVHDHLIPNFSQNGGMFTQATGSLYFARTGLTRWIVPVDDENCLYIAYRHFNEETDPYGWGDKSKVGYNTIDFYGQTDERSYEKRQTNPGDYEAWVGQGAITVHDREALGHTDQGVSMYRQRLRNAIQKLQAGEDPYLPTDLGVPIPTYAGDTLLRIPKSNDDDRQLRLDVSQKVAAIFRSGDTLVGEDRRSHIKKQLRSLEAY
jgi:nitrite reductase/ring-hydroxylating ferredoxin subunit